MSITSNSLLLNPPYNSLILGTREAAPPTTYGDPGGPLSPYPTTTLASGGGGGTTASPTTIDGVPTNVATSGGDACSTLLITTHSL